MSASYIGALVSANTSYHLVMEQMKSTLEGKKEENNAAKNEKEKHEHHRTSTGVPFLCSKSLTEDDLKRFQGKN